jgi:DNA transposition AAA+ family ATPase
MSSVNAPTEFVVTKEYRRFVEFCDACRRYQYIGLCYGPPGVGKTVSARQYAQWETVRATPSAAATALATLSGLNTVLYTPTIINTPAQVERDITALRRDLHTLHVDHAVRHDPAWITTNVQRRTKGRRHRAWMEKDWSPEAHRITNTYYQLYSQKRDEIPDPTTLILLDEADRLKMATLEQVRDMFDHGGLGIVLIGMPGIEKRLSRYPQLYSRVGFVHAFRPLSAEDIRQLLHQQWRPSGVTLPEAGETEAEAVAAIIRITGGNFRLLNRLLTQIARLLEINALHTITHQVVEAARESLVIGTV